MPFQQPGDGIDAPPGAGLAGDDKALLAAGEEPGQGDGAEG